MMPELLHLTPEKNGTTCEIDLFNEDGLYKAFKKLGWSIVDNKIIDDEGKNVLCGICKKTLTKESISAFFPSSVEAICEKMGCFMLALSKEKQQKI